MTFLLIVFFAFAELVSIPCGATIVDVPKNDPCFASAKAELRTAILNAISKQAETSAEKQLSNAGDPFSMRADINLDFDLEVERFAGQKVGVLSRTHFANSEIEYQVDLLSRGNRHLHLVFKMENRDGDCQLSSPAENVDSALPDLGFSEEPPSEMSPANL